MLHAAENYRFYFLGTIIFIFMPCFANDTDAPSAFWKTCKDAAIGGIAGGFEPLITQPLLFVKNLCQQRKNLSDIVGIIRSNPLTLYRGLGANMACSVPSISAQVALDAALEHTMPSHTIPSAIGRNLIIGGLSALTCSTTELVIINQQNSGHSAIKTIKNLYHEHGITVFGRGFLAKIARESIFCTGFLTWYPTTKAAIEKQLNNLNKTESISSINNLYATVIASGLIGGPTAVISHPFDTASTLLQADPAKKNITGYADIVHMIRQQGIGSLYRGCGSRTFLITTAIPILTWAKNYLQNKI